MRKILATSSDDPGSRRWDVATWAVQVPLAATFIGSGVWKLTTPVADLADTFSWMGEVSPAFLHMTAVFDVLGGLGVLLPSATRVWPRLTVLAALGCAALQGSAVVFHLGRGEAADTPVNVVLGGLALLVAWSRWSKAPIAPRPVAAGRRAQQPPA